MVWFVDCLHSVNKNTPEITQVMINQRTVIFYLSGERGKYVTRYDRLDLGVPVEVGHVTGVTPSLAVVPCRWIVQCQGVEY